MPRTVSLALSLLLAFAVSPLTTDTAAAARLSPGAQAASHDAKSRPDPTNRWIVLLRPGADLSVAEARLRGQGAAPDRTYRHAVRGYSARLTPAQLAAVREDPAVAEVIPDAVIEMEAQSIPRGVRRVSGLSSPIAKIDGTDQRVDADVAIVDTGIDPDHRDLNVVGGVNCSTNNRSAWQDDNWHGTHVAGTVGAIDNGTGVVGVAPGVRLWAVRILDDNGAGLVSWYVCGLDWIAAQRDPADSSRPLIEAINMSVARSGSDDHNCGRTNGDAIHRAICRVVDAGVTVVVAAGNNSFSASKLIPASYNEVITVSALADTDGKSGGSGGNACYSWGTYDSDDTFANFSNYGADVDLIAPGKCIWSSLPHDAYGYSSGTSMATPHVTGAAALYKASRPDASPAEVRAALRALGNQGWKTSTDPDSTHEPLLDVSRLLNLGDFRLSGSSPSRVVGETGGTIGVPVKVVRAEDVTGEIELSVSADSPLGASLSPRTLAGLSATSATLSIDVPPDLATGSYDVVVTGIHGGQSRTLRLTVEVDGDAPHAAVPTLGVSSGSRFEASTFTARASWGAATDATSAIDAYQVQWNADDGGWASTGDYSASARSATKSLPLGASSEVRVRARDAAGNWGAWANAGPFDVTVVQDTSSTVTRSGTWSRSSKSDWSGGSTLYSRSAGASVNRSFTGRGVAYVAPQSKSRGQAEVWIDGAKATTVDLHADSRDPRRVMYAKTWSSSGSHSIKVVVVGTKDHPRVDLDAFVIIE